MNDEKRPESGEPTPIRKHPRWLRILLMGVLVLFVGLAFYLNNLRIVEFLENR